jgi:hypothetical protein
VNIDRRAAVARMVAITGGMVIGADVFLTGCRRADKQAHTAFTPSHVALLDEIGETIIPTTHTPGAKAAGVGAFMVMMVNDCYDDRNHEIFVRGLAQIDDASHDAHGKPFMQCTPAERTALLTTIDREQREQTKQGKAGDPPHYFKLMRELTLLGYFSSEIGATQALRYVETPGRFERDVPYHKGDRAWTNVRRFG